MYGNKNKKVVSEKDIFFSKEYYGKYKIDAHKFILNKSNLNFNSTTVILFNHDSIFRGKSFLIPRIIKAFENKNISFLRKIYSENISGDFSHAEDICYGIYKLSLYKKKIDKIILSSGKRFFINKIINFLEKKFKYNINKDKLNINNKNHKFIGLNKLSKKLLNYKPKKNTLNSNEILKVKKLINFYNIFK